MSVSISICVRLGSAIFQKKSEMSKSGFQRRTFLSQFFLGMVLKYSYLRLGSEILQKKSEMSKCG